MLECVCVLLPDIHVHTETSQTIYNCDRIGFCHFLQIKPTNAKALLFAIFLAEWSQSHSICLILQ